MKVTHYTTIPVNTIFGLLDYTILFVHSNHEPSILINTTIIYVVVKGKKKDYTEQNVFSQSNMEWQTCTSTILTAVFFHGIKLLCAKCNRIIQREQASK
jgi:hypothetical protein